MKRLATCAMVLLASFALVMKSREFARRCARTEAKSLVGGEFEGPGFCNVVII